MFVFLSLDTIQRNFKKHKPGIKVTEYESNEQGARKFARIPCSEHIIHKLEYQQNVTFIPITIKTLLEPWLTNFGCLM